MFKKYSCFLTAAILSLALLMVACGNDAEPVEEAKEAPVEQIEKTVSEELPKPIVDVNKIIGKTRDEVAEIIGDEAPIEDGEKTLIYNDGEIEVYYKNDLAVCVTITPKEQYLYADKEKILALTGLEWQEPDDANDFFTEWLYVGDIYEIRIFPDFDNKENLNYIYIISASDALD